MFHASNQVGSHIFFTYNNLHHSVPLSEPLHTSHLVSRLFLSKISSI